LFDRPKPTVGYTVSMDEEEEDEEEEEEEDEE
jgi:hypothetical protein